MGGDGGVIASNRKYLRGAGTADHTGDSQRHAPEQATAHAVSQELLTTCYLTKTPLDGVNNNSIVADPYGRLYLKEAAVGALLRRKHGRDALGAHVRGLKDLYNVRFQFTAGKPTCPITAIELNGRHPALLVRCHEGVNVLSERALKELGAEALRAEYGALDDVLRLAPPPCMMEEIIETVRRQQEKSSSSKKDKKRKNRELADGNIEGKKEFRRLNATQQRVQAAVQSDDVLSSLFTDTTKTMSDKEKRDTLFARMG
jgi:hypothetical protein